jgi:hypothetical protein
MNYLFLRSAYCWTHYFFIWNHLLGIPLYLLLAFDLLSDMINKVNCKYTS